MDSINIDINNILDSIADGVLGVGPRVLLVLLAVWFFNRFSRRLIHRLVKNVMVNTEHVRESEFDKREETIANMLVAIARVIVWAIGLMFILSEFNVDIAPLLASASVLGFALGFGAQSLVKDFLAGMFIIIENQYRIGDVVTINDISGTVEDITVRTTVLRDLDGNQHHISNGVITVSTNQTIAYSNINMNVGVSYDTDIDKLEKVINKVGEKLAGSETVGQFIIEAPSFLRVESFGDSSVNVKIIGKTIPGEQWRVAGELRRMIKKEFDKNKIDIPYPHQVMKIEHTKK